MREWRRLLPDLGKISFREWLLYGINHIGSLASVFTVAFGLLYYFKDDVDRYLQKQISIGIADYQSQLAPPNLLDVAGNGIIHNPKKVYRPGESVRIGFILRRNGPCNSHIEAGFIDQNGLFRSQYSYTTPSRKAAMTSDYIFFVIDITLPNLPDGWWTYHPILEVTENTEVCKRFRRRQTLPLSEPFYVEKEKT